MFYLIGAIINIVFFFCFIFYCFKAIGLIKEKSGYAAAVIMALGLMSFIFTFNIKNSKSTNDDRNNKESAINQNVSGKWRNQKIIIDKNLIFNISLNLTYFTNDSTGEISSMYANTQTSGFLMGVKWNPEKVSVVKSANPKEIVYSVSGEIESNLIGILYTHNSKYYDGVIALK